MSPSLLYEQWPPITVNELLQVMAGDPCAQVVDVREPKEYSIQYVPGSTNVPLSTLKGRKLSLDKKKPIYLLCFTGDRAVSAAHILDHLGFGNLRLVAGGLKAWQVMGFPLLSD
jgi:rhodanese-related sulfurtransferase